jgi:hypothetical protein
MGARLTTFYDHAKATGGIEARLKLALVTRMSSVQAKEAPDSPENITRFENALRQLGLS